MRAAALFALLALAACSRNGSSPSPVEAARSEPARPEVIGREINLDANMQRQANLRIEEVRPRSMAQSIQANGRLTVNENRTWRVGAITDGRLVHVLVNPGDPVQKNQLLAGMHSHDIHESRADYRKAVAELARLKTALGYAQRQRDRARRLYELKAASLEQAEHAETELKNAQTAVANAETDAERTRRHLTEFLQVHPDENEDHKEGDTEHEGDLIPVKAPAAGVVLTRNVTQGSVASSGQELFTISDLGALWMIASVNEQFLGKLRIGMVVRVFVQAYPDRPFAGRITKLGEQLDPATRTIPVRVELANQDGRLKPEMYGTAEIDIGFSAPAIFVPQSAVQQVEGANTVFVRKTSDRFQARAIQIGRVVDSQIEVLQGLGPGEQVVSQGSYLLKSQLLKGTLPE
ncbi:MAG: efflux RND transporter periplasmic adaptor subunit [Acidobacteria bacterium]|nr:efflux RND transporter periplasmic adaptor subunit [Acidobacteriota bacterium]